MTTHTTTISIGGIDYEVEVECSIAGAEHDVGIMSAYVDDWHITSVDGETSKEAIDQMHKLIEAEYGDDKFVERLHDEGAAEADDDYYDDYGDYDND
jgi:hypothetical protein